jgi:hypothetical protein
MGATDDGLPSFENAAQGGADEDKGRTLRDAEYASLTRRAATENSHALIENVHRKIVDHEAQQGTRKRKRVGKTMAFVRALEGVIGDLLSVLGRKEYAKAWVYRSVTPRSFTNDAVSSRDFNAIRRAMLALGLMEEAPGVDHWGDFGDGAFVIKRFSTRFRATPQLRELAMAHGVSPSDADSHFVQGPPEHPLVLKGSSRREPEGYKIPGKVMKFGRTGGLAAMEQTIKDLNTFINQFTLRGGTHRGYIRVFNCGDDLATYDWDLGGRFYSLGDDSYQQMISAERLKMTIDDKPVCELDIKASYLTIFHAQQGQPLDFERNPDPYQLPELTSTPREVVKAFITATFGNGEFPAKWSKKAVSDYKAEMGVSLDKQYPFAQVRDAVAAAYPLLAALRQDDAQPPLWARLMYLESQALFRTMMDLKDVGVPSLSVHDSLIVPRDNAQLAGATLSGLYRASTGATPRIVTSTFAVASPIPNDP